MRQWGRSHLTYANVISTLALFLVLGGTTYAATGGRFILGQPNSAGAPTKLFSPTTDTNGALRVGNTSTTAPGRGIVASGTLGGYGLYATGGKRSLNTAAIRGQSGSGNAIEGFSTGNPASGVYGQDNKANSYGVAGHSDDGVAVVGDSSSGWAMQALGNTTQTPTGNGFVKAMARVYPANTVHPIQGCFNSQLPPSQATSGNCGITFDGTGSPADGDHYLNFGFQINDRFASVTPLSSPAVAAGVSIYGTNTFEVTTYNIPLDQFKNYAYYIIVY